MMRFFVNDDLRARSWRKLGFYGLLLLAVCSSDGTVQAAPIKTDQIIPVKPGAQQSPDLEQAIARFNEKRFDEALILLTAAVEKNPELPPARVLLARLFLESKQLPMARAMLEQTVIELPDDPEAYRMLGDLAFNERRLAETELLFEKLSALTAAFEGNEVRKKGYESAGHAGLAAVAEARRQWEKARRHLDAWIAQDAKNAGAHHRLGQALFGLENYDGAYASLQKASELAPELPLPEITLGRLYHQAGKAEAADEWMKKAIEKAPESLPARLGVAQYQWENDQLEAAKANVDAALKLQPDSLDGQVLAGLIARYQKNLAAAEEHFQKAFLASPQNMMAANQLALVLADQTEEAKQRRAVELAENNARQSNNNTEIAATLGWIYLKQGRVEEAKKILSAVANSGRISPDTAYFLAVMADRGGNGANAIPALRSALDAAGPFAYRDDAKKLLGELEAKAPAGGADATPGQAATTPAVTAPTVTAPVPADAPTGTLVPAPAAKSSAKPAAGSKAPARPAAGSKAPAAPRPAAAGSKATPK